MDEVVILDDARYSELILGNAGLYADYFYPAIELALEFFVARIVGGNLHGAQELLADQQRNFGVAVKPAATEILRHRFN
jgi:hypothetical protein